MSLDMSNFVFIVVAMLAIACLFVVIPFIKFNRENTNRGLKSQWYKSRLEELNQELATGRFSQQEFDDALTELKLTATAELRMEVDSTDGLTNAGEQQSIKGYLIASVVLFVSATGFAYYQYGEREKLVEWEATLARMPELSQQIIQNSAAEPSEKDLQDFALALRTKLNDEPQAIGWMLLGRNLNMLRDLDGAIDAFDKSLKMDGRSVSTIVSLGQALQERGEPGDYRRSIRLLKGALSLNPQNLTALILLAEGEMLNEEFESSLEGFSLIEKVIPATDPRKIAVGQRIAFLTDKLNSDGATTQRSVASQSEEPVAAGVTIVVDIIVDDNVALNDFSHLFVFAKSPDMPMPLAVKKIAITDLTVMKQKANNKVWQVELSEKDVMMPTLSLASQSVVDVFVRLSTDPQAPYQPGDIQAFENGVELLPTTDDTPVTQTVQLTLSNP